MSYNEHIIHLEIFECLWEMIKTRAHNFLRLPIGHSFIYPWISTSVTLPHSIDWFALVITSVASPQANSVWSACFNRTHVCIFSHPYLKVIFIGFSIVNGTRCEVCMKVNFLTEHPGFRDSVPCDGSVLYSSIALRGRPRNSFCTILLRPGTVKTIFFLVAFPLVDSELKPLGVKVTSQDTSPTLPPTAI